MTTAYHDQLIEIRRRLHQNPEEGWSEFTTTAFIVQTLRGYGYEVLCGRKVVNPDFCLGRDMKVVQAGIERAHKNGVSQELLDEMQELTGCVAVLDTGRPVRRLPCALTSTACPSPKAQIPRTFPPNLALFRRTLV